jgi:hypothetical protein
VTLSVACERVSAETVCEILHKAFRGDATDLAADATTIRVDALSAADECALRLRSQCTLTVHTELSCSLFRSSQLAPYPSPTVQRVGPFRNKRGGPSLARLALGGITLLVSSVSIRSLEASGLGPAESYRLLQ